MRMALAFAAVLLAPMLALAQASLPAPVAELVPAAKRVGETRFHKYFFHVYDAALWAPGARYAKDAPHVLEIRYARDFKGRDLAARSVHEMRHQGHRDEARLARWEAEMARVFPDIKAGDRLVGVALPGREARFHDGTRWLGTVADPGFVDAFFGIWLAEATSEPAMRRELLGARPDR